MKESIQMKNSDKELFGKKRVKPREREQESRREMREHLKRLEDEIAERSYPKKEIIHYESPFSRDQRLREEILFKSYKTRTVRVYQIWANRRRGKGLLSMPGSRTPSTD
jgi:hypothetical protein